jgi:hypothetical protein
MTRGEWIAEWGDAAYNARENYTVDPHEHIERLITLGDALAALSTPAPAGLVALVRRVQEAYALVGLARGRLLNAQAAGDYAEALDDLLAFPLPEVPDGSPSR